MATVTIVLFSKDRPLQLDAALRSFDLHCDDLGTARLRVIYTTSAADYEAGYRVLRVQHPGVEFIRESDFKADLLTAVGDAQRIVFLVDDTLFVRPMSLSSASRCLDEHSDLIGFSFRLGRNTTYCYPLDSAQALPRFSRLGPGIVAYEWGDSDNDFGYPLELSQSMYRASDIAARLGDLGYTNPNTLEAALAGAAQELLAERPRLACFEQSTAFSAPVNVVQATYENRAGSDASLSTAMLLDRFMQGDRLDVASYAGLEPRGCHEEVGFVYRDDPAIPAVSVVTRCYKQGAHLPDAVSSVVAQTFRDWEVVLVPDGSPDDAAEVAHRLIADAPAERIRLVEGPNAGLSGAMNRGVEAALGRYILPLDADDMIEPRMMERTVELLEARLEIAIAYTDLRHFGEYDAIIELLDFDPEVLPEVNHLNYCSLYRREVWEANHGYNPNMTRGYEDWDFWIGASELGYRAARIPEPLLLYRYNSAGMHTTALTHDKEMRRQIRANHPDTFGATRRLRRWLESRAKRLSGGSFGGLG